MGRAIQRTKTNDKRELSRRACRFSCSFVILRVEQYNWQISMSLITEAVTFWIYSFQTKMTIFEIATKILKLFRYTFTTAISLHAAFKNKLSQWVWIKKLWHFESTSSNQNDDFQNCDCKILKLFKYIFKTAVSLHAAFKIKLSQWVWIKKLWHFESTVFKPKWRFSKLRL